MKVDTFGNPEEIKSLPYLTECISLLPESSRIYMSSFLTDFNTRYKELCKIENKKFKRYCGYLIREHYRVIIKDAQKRFDDRKVEYKANLFTYLDNFIVTKLKIECL